MTKWILAAAAATMVASCSEAPEQNAAEAKPAKLTPGEYEVTAKVDQVTSTDKTTPATSLKAGDSSEPVRTCIADDGKIDPKLFAETGDNCTQQTRYVSRGRMNLQYQCTRPGKGQVAAAVEGTFTADGFEAGVVTSTYMSGDGDYAMKRTFTAKRVGECSAPAAAG